MVISLYFKYDSLNFLHDFLYFIIFIKFSCVSKIFKVY